MFALGLCHPFLKDLIAMTHLTLPFFLSRYNSVSSYCFMNLPLSHVLGSLFQDFVPMVRDDLEVRGVGVCDSDSPTEYEVERVTRIAKVCQSLTFPQLVQLHFLQNILKVRRFKFRIKLEQGHAPHERLD